MTQCFHCNLPIASGATFSGEINGNSEMFCCPACLAVAQCIDSSGLKDYYQYKQASESPAPSTSIANQKLVIFDNLKSLDRYIRIEKTSKNSAGTDAPTIYSITLYLEGIHCTACTWLIEKYLKQLDGIEKVQANFSNHTATISWDDEKISLRSIAENLANIGYVADIYTADKLLASQKRENKAALSRLAIAGLAMMQIGMFSIALYSAEFSSIQKEYWHLLRWASLIVCLPVIFFSAQTFFIGAWRSLKLKSFGMDVPVAIALGTTFIASVKATVSNTGEIYFDSVAMFSFLLLLGRFIEMKTRHYTGRLYTDVLDILPRSAHRINNTGTAESIPIASLSVGNTLLVQPGQIIPADGTIIENSSSVSEAQVTGEFSPTTKSLGDAVLAGSHNIENPIKIQVQACGSDLKLEKINTLTRQGLSKKPKFSQLIDRISGYFVATVLSLASLAYIYWYFIDPTKAFWIAIAVLVVSCPCALSLATPAVVSNANHRLRRLGLIVTKSNVWDKISDINHIVWDKTGTLTSGEYHIGEIKTLNNANKQSCLELAASLEALSDHPIANAFKSYETRQCDSPQIHIGEGIEAIIDRKKYRIGKPSFVQALFNQSDSIFQQPTDAQWILFANEDSALCWFRIEDCPREESKQIIETCHQLGIQTHLLSGDQSSRSQELANKLNIQHCVAGASPEDKLKYIQTLQTEGDSVMMVGDGINDIPTLAAADISISMGHASDLAKTHADCVLLTNKLETIANFFHLAQKANIKIKQNIFWAIAYNAGAIPFAFLGLIPPYLAALGMSLSSLIVILNASSITRWQPNTELPNANKSPEKLGKQKDPRLDGALEKPSMSESLL